MKAVTGVPEQGQPVRARGRLWVLSEVAAAPPAPKRVVALVSIEDDAFGDEIERSAASWPW